MIASQKTTRSTFTESNAMLKTFQRLSALPRALRAALPFYDAESNPVVFVLGTGRSGTTWLAEQLSYAMSGRIIFEPMHPVANGRPPSIDERIYLRVSDSAPDWNHLFDRIVSGRIRGRWNDRYNTRFVYNARIIKLIRGNLMFGWLARQYPEATFALVIRDPIDVARSQLRGGWPLEIKRFTCQPAMMEDYPILDSPLVTEAKTQFEFNVLHWAIENRVALDQLAIAEDEGARVAVFQYEQLRDDHGTFLRFLQFCGASTDEEAIQHVKRPSRVSRKNTESVPTTHKENFFAEAVTTAFNLGPYFTSRVGDKDVKRSDAL